MLRTLPPAATCTTSSTSARNTGLLFNLGFFSCFLPPGLVLKSFSLRPAWMPPKRPAEWAG